ncbi:MAG: autotransporter-associated beta strand repeat-containing protein, partial [Alphaproteobacteria bacterium]|nr:autotransporter-associated beta strand repeat-containing protein [Alphaproteobacteria bacterium]
MVGLARTGLAPRPRRVMRAALLLSTALTAATFVVAPAAAQNATWEGDVSNSFNDGANWSTGSVPSGAATAFFGTSPTTSVTLAGGRTLGTIQFNSGADAYTIDINGSGTLQFNSQGIVNNSAQQQNFHLQNAGMSFFGSSSAGNQQVTITLDAGGQMGFAFNSTAGAANIVSNAGSIYFYDNASGGTATYTGGASSLLNIAGLTASGMTIGSIAGSGSIVATGKAITVGGNNTTTAFGGVIAGAGGSLIKVGSGTLTLSGANTYTGSTTINAGTLSIASDSGLGAAGGALNFQSGTLQVTASTSMNRATTIAGANATFDIASGATVVQSGTISGAGQLIKTGTGTLQLNGANGYTGGTTVNGGTLVGTTNSLQGDIANNGTVQFNQNFNGTYAGTLSGTGNLVVVANTGSTGLTLSGTNTFSGGTTVSGIGTLTITSDAALGAVTSGLTLQSLGTLVFGSSFNLASTRAISIGSGGGRISTNGFDTTISQSINGPGVFDKHGAGTLTLTAANTFSGLGIYGGAVAVSANNQLGSSSTVSLSGGGTLKVGSTFSTVRYLALGSGGGGLDVTNAAATLTWGDNVLGGGSLTKAGAGTVVLTGFSNSYTGGTVVADGVLQIADDGKLGGAAGALTFQGGTLRVTGSTSMNRATTISGASGTFEITGSASVVQSGGIGGTGQLIKTGTGTLQLTGANGYTGGTTVSAGTLIGTTNSLQGNIANYGTVQFNQTSNGTYAGILSGSGNLVVNASVGSTGLTLAGTNTFSGGTTVSGIGTLTIMSDAALGSATSGLTINNSTLVFGANFTLASTRPISMGSGGQISTNGFDITMAGGITGPGYLTKKGAGTLTFTTANTFSGLSIEAGVVVISAENQLGSGASGSGIANGAVLRTGTTFTTGRSLSLYGGDGVLEVTGASTTVTWGGFLYDSGRLSKAGAGTLILTNMNTHTGGTIVTDGVLQVSADYNLGGSGGLLTLQGGSLRTATSVTLGRNVAGSGGSLDTGSNNVAITGTLTGTALTKTGTGSLTVASTSVADLNIGQGTVIIGDAANFTSRVNFQGSGATLRLASGTLTMMSAVDVGNSGGTLSVDSGATLTLSAVTGPGGLTKTGAGTLSLGGANSYTGGTTINAGVLVISANTALGDAAGGITFNGGTLRTTADAVMNRAIVLNASSTIENNAILQLHGVISGSGDLIKAGSGVLALYAGNTFTGRLIINQSVVAIDSNALPVGDMVIASGASVNFANYNSSQTYAGTISGAGQVYQSGSGTTTLTGANTYAGGTLIGGSGTLAVSSDANLGDASGSISFQGGKLKFLSSFDLASTRAIHLSNFGGTFLLNGATTTFGGMIDTTGPLTIDGAGSMTLTGANTYSGGTIVSGGATLAIANDAAMGTGGLILDNGTLKLGGNFNLPNTPFIVMAAGGGTIDTNGFNSTIGQAIEGAGGLSKAGAGTLTLTGANTYQGMTTINGGTLAISSNDPLASTSGLTINGGGTLQVSSVASLNLPVTLNGAATFNVAGGADGLSLSGHVGGSGSLTKTGAGSLTLRGTADYSGGTTVSGGSLVGSAANLQGNITNNAIVYFGQDADGTYSGVMSGGGTLSKFGSATLTLTGLNTYQGLTQVTAGTLAVGRDENLGASTTDIRLFNGGTLRLLSSFDLAAGRDVELSTAGRLQLVNSTNTIAGAIHGSGTLAIEGAGILTLAGTNTFIGAVSVTGSTLAITADASLGDASNGLSLDAATLRFGSSFTLAGTRAITLGAGSTIDTNGFDATIASTISGSNGLTKNGAGKLSLTGTNTYSGDTVISGGGTLAIASDAALGNVTNGVTFDNGTLQFLASFDLANTRALTL